jgi:uncharacterized RDD family membrane protein YckC
MFCPFCGVKNDDGQTSCFVCGKRLPSFDAETPTPRPRSTFRPVSTSPVAARLGDRFIAVILDTLFLSALVLVIAAALSTSVARLTLPFITLVALASVGVLLLVFLYHWLLEGAFGATMGKAIVGVRVAPQGGGAMNFRSAAVRNLFRLLDALPFYLLGFFVAIFSPGRRRIGDFAAHTVVLEQAPTLGSRITVVLLWLAGIAGAIWGAYALSPEWFQLPSR